MARARWGTRRVLLTRASLFAGDAVLLHHAVELCFARPYSRRAADEIPWGVITRKLCHREMVHVKHEERIAHIGMLVSHLDGRFL
jgi:hypothetical protein